MLLEEMTTLDVKSYLENKNIVLIPVGSVEQHGPANPLGTDFFIAQHVSRKASQKARIICAPSIPIGISEHHATFDGTVWVRPKIYMDFIKQYTQSLISQGFKKVIIINGHGGNTVYLKQIANEIYFDQQITVIAANWWDFISSIKLADFFPENKFSHAEEIETSINLAINPQLVKLDRIVNIENPPKKWGKFLADIQLPAYVKEFSPNGIVGNLDNINQEYGLKTLEVVINKLVDFIIDFQSF